MENVIRVIFVVIVAFLGSMITRRNLEWYDNPVNVTKSQISPPGRVFGIAWAILYALYAWAWILQSKKANNLDNLFIIGMVLNLAWVIAFFHLHDKMLGMIIILSMVVFTIYQASVMYKTGNKLGTWFMVAYIAWLSFASCLNATTTIINP